MTFEQFLLALRQVETGGLPDRGEFAIGDGGDAIGPLQIHACTYEDAMDWLDDCCERDLAQGQFVPTFSNTARVPGLKYELCNYWTFSCQVAWLYFRRHCPRALARMWQPDCRKMARIWNGGPRGHRKQATLPYEERFVDIARKKGWL